MKLSDLIIETRRILLTKVGLNVGVRRSQGLECQPNVSCGEISEIILIYQVLIQV